MRPDGATDALAAAFTDQIGWCGRLGSPFTARVISALLGDLGADGQTARLVGGWSGDARADALPLRLAGALHALAITGRDPALARRYPPHPPASDLELVIPEALERHDAFVRDFLGSPPQTNEVGRAAILVGGFLEVARTFGLPLATLEIGASAGLNLHWDQFHHRLGRVAWGDPDASVRLAPDWSGPPPPVDAPLSVVARAGCDRRPVDLSNPDERLRLRAYVWADQDHRLRALDGAVDVARATGTAVEAADAADWLERRLAEGRDDAVTTVYHTVVWQYLPAETKARIEAALEAYGRARPLARLAFEQAAPDLFALTLIAWKDGVRTERRLAEAHPHGAAVRWLG